ncbi:MAG: tetratricopeptide repeat protein [Dysgonamonadaceae bacterium]|jgi:tetratricopeptide (TPR) repeat protein|nr:tetratricopeptide repeat protein [Dysgonamonadaceae bacterium]
MLKLRYILAAFGCLALLVACTSAKNTAGTRWYHSFNTRYNVYFNGETAYQAALKAQQEGYEDNYSKMLPMFVISALPKDKTGTGGPFDKAIEKSVKAIKTHSIQTKPEKQPAKQNDPHYREWMNRTEYNPFLHHAWLLMAKSQFHNGDFLEAASSFSYISRLYLTQPEIALNAKIWQARCYTEIAWFYEAEDILSKVRKDGLPPSLRDWYDTVYADFLIQQKRYAEAVPYLQTAVRAEKNRGQKDRERYLLGQIYSTLGETSLAYETFGKVSGAYPLEFAAKIRQTEVLAGIPPERIARQLRKMAKSSKNKNYLDQIYYALGNIYLSIPDTAKAIESYETGVEKSVRQGLDKALNQIQLGDLYFEKRKFMSAQPHYAEALPQLKKEDEAWPRVSKRSAVLDELVVYAEAVELQDSLQRLSRMTEDERLTVVQNLIDDLRKKEADEQARQEREDYLAQQEDMRAQQNANRPNAPRPPVMAPGNENTFYFYNPQVVAVGKTAFQQKWGRRKLEDDWRRRDKTNPMSDALADTHPDEPENLPDTPLPETGVEPATDAPEDAPAGASDDPYDPQFYLQQIPVSEEDIAASNRIIADGLYNMAVVYKDGLGDLPLALETFDQLDTRFPDHENQLQAYYHTYLIYLKEDHPAMADAYKQKIRAAFPESELAIAMAHPDYEHNLRTMDAQVDSLYRDTYEAYLSGEVDRVRSHYATAEQAYATSKLMPKFMFLHALTYVQTRDAEQFKAQLKALIAKYPDADVSVLASEMMKGFQRGLLLSASGDNLLARGGLFTVRFGGSDEDALAIDSIPFSPATATPHELLIVYPPNAIDDNLLLYTVASFNFGNFVRADFDIERTRVGDAIGLLRIKGFGNFTEVMQYVRMIDGPEGYAPGLEQSVVVVPVSVENYTILMQGKTLESYMQFFEEQFGKDHPQLIERWKSAQLQEQQGAVEMTPETSGTSEITESPAEPAAVEPPLPVAPDSIPSTQPADTLTIYDLERQRAEQTTDELAARTENLLEQGSQIADDVTNTLNEISADPVRGLQKLFSKLFGKKSTNAIDEYAKEQEKAEKARQKQLKQEKAAADKALRAEALQKEKERQAKSKANEAARKKRKK